MRQILFLLVAAIQLTVPGGAWGQSQQPPVPEQQISRQQVFQQPIELWNKLYHERDFAGAGELATRMLQATPLNDVRGRAFWLTRYAAVRSDSGDLDSGEATFREAIALLHKAEIVDETEFFALRGLTQLTARRGDLDKAFQTIAGALKRSGDVLGEHHVEFAYNLSALGGIEQARGRLPQAAAAYDRARHIFRAAQGDAGFGFEDNTARLAVLRAHQGLLQKAVTLLDEALARFERKLTAQFPPVVDLRLNKADLLTRLGQPEEAAAAARRAYEDARQIHPPHHPRIVYAASRLVDKLNGLGRVAEARALIAQALDSASLRGRETPEYASMLLMSSAVSFIGERVAKAVAESQLALDIMEKIAPPQHPAVVPFINALAQYTQAAGDLDEAVLLSERALGIIQGSDQMRGVDPSISADILNRLSQIYAAQGRFAQAEPAMRRALNIYRDIYSADHDVVLSALYELIGQFNTQGRYSEGVALAERVLEIAEKKYGQGSQATAGLLIAVAIGLTGLEQRDEAEKYFLLWQRVADSGELTASAMVFGLTNYGEFRRRNGQPDEALELLNRAIAVAKQNDLLPNSTGPARVFRAIAHLDNGAAARAETALREMLEYYRQTNGDQSFQVIGLRRSIAKAAAKQARYEEAEAMLLTSLGDLEFKVGPDSAMLRPTLELQRAIYEKWQKPDQLAAVERRLAALPPEGTRHLRLLFATNRKKDEGTSAFSVRDAGSLSYGISTVKVPESEIVHQAERRAGSFGQLHAAKGRLAETTRLEILGTSVADRAAFFGSVREAADRASRFNGQAVVFIHGFNNDFDSALLRASQIAFDLDFDGPIIAFSWPSRGSLLRYGADEEAAAGAVPRLAGLLAQLHQEAPGVRIHLIAHSMGNRVLIGALGLLAKRNKQPVGRPMFGEAILAHPDIAPESVEKVAESARDLVRGFTLYATDNDTALAISRILNWTNRAGSTTKGIAGVDTIDVSGMKAADATGWARFFVLNHSTFVRNPVLFGEITRLLQTGERPVHLRSFGHFERSGEPDDRLWRYTGRDLPLGVAAKTEAQIANSEEVAPAGLQAQ